MSFWPLPNRYWILKTELLHIEIWIYFKPLCWVKVLAINMVHLDVFGSNGCVFLTLGVTASKNLGGWVGWHGLKIWVDECLLWITTSVWQISGDPVDVNTKSCRKERKKGQYSILNPTKSHTVKMSTCMYECVCVWGWPFFCTTREFVTKEYMVLQHLLVISLLSTTSSC